MIEDMDTIVKKYNENKLIDLHSHTTFSDGELTPNDLVRYASKKDVKILGITDHDTLEGVKNIDDEVVKESGLILIKGIELSAKVDAGRMHILGYNIDINNPELNKIVDRLRDNRVNTVITKLNELHRLYGIRFSYDDIRELINLPRSIGSPDLAKLCVKYGYAKDVNEAFDKYLNPSREGIQKYFCEISYKECIEAINKAGGIAVLAHPKSLKVSPSCLSTLIEDMVKCGLRGIEAYHSSHNEEETKLYLEIAKRYNLLVSGGSDYHGPVTKPLVEIGTGQNKNLNLERLSIVDSFCR